MGKQTGPRFTMAEMLAIFKAQSEGKSLDDASQEILGARATDSKIDRAAIQTKIDTFLASAKMPETDKVFSHLAKIAELVAIAEKEQNAIAANLIATLNADEKPLVKVADKMTTGTVENGMRVNYSRLGIVVPVRKEIVHDANFKRADGFTLIANADKLAQEEKDKSTLAWLAAFKGYPQGTIFHNKTLRAIDAKFGNADKGQNYGAGSKCMTWLEPYYKPELTDAGKARIEAAQTKLANAEKNALA